MQLQWRLPWFQPLPQILIKITIGRGIAGGSHAIASIFHNSQRRAAILFRQFTLVSLPFQKFTFSLFIFCIFMFNIFSSNFHNSCEAIQSYFTSARYYYSQRFVTDFLTFCCWNTSPALHKGQNRQKIRFFNCASSSIVWLNSLRKNSWILNAIHKLWKRNVYSSVLFLMKLKVKVDDLNISLGPRKEIWNLKFSRCIINQTTPLKQKIWIII